MAAWQRSTLLKIISVLLALVVILAGLCLFLFMRSPDPNSPSSFQPLSTQVDDSTRVGKMRLPKLYAISNWLDTTDDDMVKLEFVEVRPGDPSLEQEKGFEVVRIKWTVKQDIPGEYLSYYHDPNFWILYFCPEDGFWYALYNPSYAIRTYGEGQIGPSEYTVNYCVPPDLLAQPGLYAIAFEGVGCCQFEIE